MRGTTREWMHHRCRRWWWTSRPEIVLDIQQLGNPPNTCTRRRTLSRLRCSRPSSPRCIPTPCRCRHPQRLPPFCWASPQLFLRAPPLCIPAGRSESGALGSGPSSVIHVRPIPDCHVRALLIAGILRSLITASSPPPPRLLLSCSPMRPPET
ncbi:hypothetical protein B0H13DRAFT_1173585 [Mycena leptocephala]|nr:hypothetical protein B0H13DRAFT_1173585 [Mycena leptocephala]